jgi:hypothetical protein
MPAFVRRRQLSSIPGAFQEYIPFNTYTWHNQHFSEASYRSCEWPRVLVSGHKEPSKAPDAPYLGSVAPEVDFLDTRHGAIVPWWSCVVDGYLLKHRDKEVIRGLILDEGAGISDRSLFSGFPDPGISMTSTHHKLVTLFSNNMRSRFSRLITTHIWWR